MFKGITLIEWLVIVTIIGIMLSIAVPQYFAHLERQKVEDVHRPSLG